MQTFSGIIDKWPSLQEFAEDIGVKYVTAQVMRHRNSIDSKHWKALVCGAEKRLFADVTLEALAEIAADRATQPRPRKRREMQSAA